jgi:YidC/Oxa1 family membrane protein insertase
MENIRLVLIILLSFIGLMLWEAWQRDYATPPAPTTASSDSAGAGAPMTDNRPDVPQAASTPSAPPAAAAPGVTAKPVIVETDTFEIRINPTGAVIEQIALKQYPLSLDKGAALFTLLANDETRVMLAQGGLKAASASPDHYAQYSAGAERYTLADGEDSLVVERTWRAPEGVEVVRRFTFQRGSYEIGQTFEVRNQSGAEWKAHPYEQLQRVRPPEKRTMMPTFTGAAFSSPDSKYDKFDFDDLVDEPYDRDATGGWAALVEHYFVAALIPPAELQQHYYSTALGDERIVVGYYGQELAVPPGETRTVSSRFYAGPKIQDLLPGVAPGLELTVDYGALWFIAKGLFWLLEKIHALFGNWGIAIILLTLLVKLMFFPLSAAGYRSMARMRKVQPRLVALKERFGDDRAKMNQAMMDLYKQEKINPLGGCLPILVQIPVFIALYWVLLESVELRQAPFLLWIKDLSIKDPYFVLPVLMTASMWAQSKMNPAPLDPVQAKVMQIMPLAFGVFFAFFPAGLVLYWLVNNVLSIAQQWYVTRQIAAAA